MATPSRPALKYFGGKWLVADWIIGYFPPHETYVEPFGGAASVLLRKPRSSIEVYNDIHGEVVNFFRVLRDRPSDLLRAIELTPYSREEWELSLSPEGDELERARRFYVNSWQSYGVGGTNNDSSWRIARTRAGRGNTPVDDWTNTGHMQDVVARLQGVFIERDNALEVLHRYDQKRTLFYVDPPYVHSTRVHKARYEGEMTDDDHAALAEALHAVDGMVIVSGYPSTLYDELYAGWETADRLAVTNGGGKRTERLWLSPAVSERRLPLFANLS